MDDSVLNSVLSIWMRAHAGPKLQPVPSRCALCMISVPFAFNSPAYMWVGHAVNSSTKSFIYIQMNSANGFLVADHDRSWERHEQQA